MTLYVGTSTRYQEGEGQNQDAIREQLARQFLHAACALPDTVVVVVDGGSQFGFPEYADSLSGVEVYAQVGRGMHQARLEVFQHIQELSQSPEDVVVWCEPEKVGFVQHIQYLAEINVDMVMPTRISMDSYPPFQVHTERAAALFVERLVGENWDEFFGPVLFRVELLPCFLDFRLEDFGVSPRYSGWLLNHGPRLVAMKNGARIAAVPVDYRHPVSQTRSETGNLAMNLKRVEQMQNLLPILWIIAHQLGLTEEAPLASEVARLAK